VGGGAVKAGEVKAFSERHAQMTSKSRKCLKGRSGENLAGSVYFKTTGTAIQEEGDVEGQQGKNRKKGKLLGSKERISRTTLLHNPLIKSQ